MANKLYQARFGHGKISPTPSPVENGACLGPLADHHERLADGYLAPCTDEDVAADYILDDIRKNNKANFVNAIHAYVLTRPGIKYADLQNFLLSHGVNCTQPVVDASEVDINVQQTLTDLQGNIDKIYPIHFDFLPSTTDVGTRQQLHAIVPSKHLVAAGHVISCGQFPTCTRADSQSTVSTDDCDAFTGWLVESELVTASFSNTNGQPPLPVAAPNENTTSVRARADQGCASSEIQVPTPTAPSPVTLSGQPLAPTQSLALSNNAAFFTIPASFNVNAYSSAGANTHSEPVVKEGGGLVSSPCTDAGFRPWQWSRHPEQVRHKLTIGHQILPDIISGDSELWAQAKRAVSPSNPPPAHISPYSTMLATAFPPFLSLVSVWRIY